MLQENRPDPLPPPAAAPDDGRHHENHPREAALENAARWPGMDHAAVHATALDLAEKAAVNNPSLAVAGGPSERIVPHSCE